jgi:hypothetical protein
MLMNRSLLLGLLAVAAVGCSIIQPTSKPTSTPAPTALVAVVTATVAPSATSLPPTPTAAATQVSTVTDTPAATNTTAPTDTPAATPTNTRVPVTPIPKPTATATNTTVALKYAAPLLIEPSGQSFQAGKDDLRFEWHPVTDLGANECYQVTVRVTNLTDPARNYAQDSFLALNTCNSTLSGGTVTFSLLKRNPPTYSGLIAQAETLGGQSNIFDVKWWVTVVRNDGTPLSPPSAMFEFTLND